MANNKNIKVPNVPNLRFPIFTDKWEAGKLDEYILLVSGQDLSPEQYTDKEDVYPYITGASSLNSEGIILNRWIHTPTQIVKRGDILLVCKGSGVGQLTVLSNIDKAHIARQIMGIRANNAESQLFIYHYLSRLMTELKKRSTGIIPGIDRKSILSLHISIPSLQEQQKIAKFLNLIEQRIITQSKIIEDLKKLKSAIIEKLYSDIQGKEYSYRQLFEVVNERNKQMEYSNILAASQEKGMVSRDDLNLDIQFERSNINTYKIVREGDYVIHLRSFQGGFAFSNKTGVCSPAYTILRPNALLEYGYLSYYFMSYRFIKSLIIVTYGIRDGRSISVEEWLNLKISIPFKEHQLHILKVLRSFDWKIENEEAYATHLSNQKQYLLRQMFI